MTLTDTISNLQTQLNAVNAEMQRLTDARKRSEQIITYSFSQRYGPTWYKNPTYYASFDSQRKLLNDTILTQQKTLSEQANNLTLEIRHLKTEQANTKDEMINTENPFNAVVSNPIIKLDEPIITNQEVGHAPVSQPNNIGLIAILIAAGLLIG